LAPRLAQYLRASTPTKFQLFQMLISNVHCYPLPILSGRPAMKSSALIARIVGL
jgi:hypothetical protein